MPKGLEYGKGSMPDMEGNFQWSTGHGYGRHGEDIFNSGIAIWFQLTKFVHTRKI